MFRVQLALLFGLCSPLFLICRAAPPLGAGTAAPAAWEARSGAASGRKLRGKFLHITDVHPDPFYKTYSSTDEDAACHRKRGPAGVYGAETSACDAPISLVNETFKWIDEHLKDEIDFVIWTGDSARHDNDEKIPRTQDQVIEQNELLVTKFLEVFGNGDDDEDPTNDFIIPIVPTFGNNDVMPHNIFLAGPNTWSLKYLDIWKNFIPEAQRHQFAQGGWFSVEVIPHQLAVISLNTLYFFDSNSAVDGCAAKSEPGYEHMEWLRIQLQMLRERGMKAILIGHVPPARTDSKSSWDETCWQKYSLWMRQYRDIIVGTMYGHMNIDHFMLQDFKDLKKSTKKGNMKSLDARVSMLDDGEMTTASTSDYLIDLRDEWSKLPVPAKSLSEAVEENKEPSSSLNWLKHKISTTKKKSKNGKHGKGSKKTFFDKIGGPWGERFSVSLVSPSVVPNYFPTLRVFEYNITGLDDVVIPLKQSGAVSMQTLQSPLTSDELKSARDDEYELLGKKEKESRKRKKHKFKVPKPPSKSAPPGPAYSPQTLTFVGYTQYFANLTHINNDFVGAFQSNDDVHDFVNATRWKEGKHHGKKSKHNKPQPKKFKYEVEYNTSKDKHFQLKDLTVMSYLDLARRIGDAERKGKSNQLFTSEDEDQFDNEEMDIEDDEAANDEMETERKKKHKKKKGGKKKKKHYKKNNTWFTFVKRAFVGTKDLDSLEEQFGAMEDAAEEAEDVYESLEL